MNDGFCKQLMSEPEFDRDNPDAESMFDFLAEEGEEKHRRKKRAAETSERPLPIIRKPVPVSESGPLLPPKRGAPVEPPPALTSGAKEVEDELDFLDDMPAVTTPAQPRQTGFDKPDSDSNITRLAPRGRRMPGGRDRSSGSGTSNPESGRIRKAPVSRNDEFELDLDDAPEFKRNWKGVGTVIQDIDDEETPRRGRWLVLALVLIAAGAASFLFAFPDDWRSLVQKFGVTTGTVAGNPPEIDPDGEPLDGGVMTAASPMMQRFQKQLSLVEGLIAEGALDEAEQTLSRMDRTVYGYGAAEFGELESRITQLRSGVAVADPGAEQAGQGEAARVAAEQKAQAARDEDARIAAAAQEESARQAAEQSAREEQARVAAEKAAQEERARADAQQAAREQQAKLDAEKARQEAARQEEQARLAAQEARTSDWPSVDADRQATDRRIAEERAAVQRQQAREQRLIEARQREAALAAQAASKRPLAEVETNEAIAVPAENSVANADNAVSETRSIGDDELQTVYRRFIELQQAVSNRDINAVVGLTQRSGARVQQLMQIFENSTQIDARIRNVSTSNATGQIKGTLQINRIKRADGTFVEPPTALSSIPLSSQREGDGWSAIAW